MRISPALLGLLLALVLLAPAGYMPGPGGWVICTEGLPPGALDGHHHHEETAPTCPFSLLATAAGGPQVAVLAPTTPALPDTAPLPVPPTLTPRPRPQHPRAPPPTFA